MVIYPLTVKDDLTEALKVELNVTDAFHLTIPDGQIIAVETSSNDPNIL
jgi:hypothetical protein